ncbi:uncharacterized protein LOC122393710 [Amphibalanus amphitrite]|uniref:uncharacterized protein LOC122393710 n=1 Tax=Amphibalanus amphitrite TaxID=1232801 RepID=UPI001C9128A2|nr:uncharacterized protein LOC122393710 [Amphibalanus amphitrite]
MLQITGPMDELRLSNVECTGESRPSMRIRLQVSPLTSDSEAGTVTITEAFTVPTLNIRPSTVDWSKRATWKHLADIQVPNTNQKKVELLLGANVLEALVQKEVRVGKPGQPVAVRTHFGWCLAGNISSVLPVAAREVMHIVRHRSEEEELTEQIQEWWSTEAFGTAYKREQPHSWEDRQAENQMKQTTQWRGDRYETGLLWRSEGTKLPDNYNMASRRLETTERLLKRAPDKAKSYQETIAEYVANGYARKISETGTQPEGGQIWYLPHHAVTNQTKPGKFRVVFDAAAKCSGVSLNECLLTGPDLLRTVPGVLMRFRQQAVAVTADIEKMFLQIGVIERDQSVLRFLWRDLDSSRPPDVYQMDRVVFGARSSPAMASYVLNRTAEDKVSNTPVGMVAAKTVKENFYMDDLAMSETSVTTALDTAKEVQALVARGGFRLRKFLSNSAQVLQAFPAEERMSGAIDLNSALPVEKVLGVAWDAQLDELFISTPAIISKKPTKREVLRVVASIFDPLGLVSPFTLIAKLLLQELWAHHQDWDAEIPEDSLRKWTAWLADLPRLEDVKVHRWYGAKENAVIRQLHVFCDASASAFGAVAYMRLVYPDGQIHCALIMSRCRVAPLKKLTIVRLETQAAVLAVRLAASIEAELTLDVQETIYWSDSQVVLSYIGNDSKRFHTFIANRVAEIRDASEPYQWRHVPGERNPADDCSRGVMAADLTKESRWITGPDFLWKPEEQWPGDCERYPLDSSDPEAKIVLASSGVMETPPRMLPDAVRFSSWSRLQRTTGWILRFLNNYTASHAPNSELSKLSGPLSTEELQRAEATVIKQAQQCGFGQEVEALKAGKAVPSASRLQPLTPQLDKNGVIRVGGRLSNAPVPERARHPIILPRDNRVTTLIIQAAHQRLLHAGADQVLNELQQEFWIPRGQALVRKVVHDCTVCRRRRASPCQPQMADLPAARFDMRHPFSSVGIDYFGPLLVKTGRGKKEKRYCLLVTCMASRAVHMEVSQSLTTDSFLLAFHRFTARRGRPAEVLSDNGTNLRAGERELRRLLLAWNQNAIADRLAQDMVKWHFNPPASSDMGGVWEAMIATVKRALSVVLGKLLVTDEVLRTVITEVEAVVNSRPLTYVSTEVGSLEALTPNHLLLGRPLMQLPPDVTVDNPSHHRIWRQSQAPSAQFWKRWLREYVPNLVYRRKWTREDRNLTPGDLILLAEDGVPRGHWPLGRVIEVFPGRDGRVRSARVRVRGGIVHRPARKLCLLEGASTE